MEIELYFVPLCIFIGVFVLGGVLILPGVRGRERYYLGFEFIQQCTIQWKNFPDSGRTFQIILNVIFTGAKQNVSSAVNRSIRI